MPKKRGQSKLMSFKKAKKGSGWGGVKLKS